MSDLHLDDRLSDLRDRIDMWLGEFASENPLIAAVDRGTSDDSPFGEPRWYVRMTGEAKEFTTVWLTLGQRTLRYETYVMPSPPEHHSEVMELLMRRNDSTTGAHFSVGAEDAVFLRGEIPNSAVTSDEVDRILGTLYSTVEANFAVLVSLAFASRFGDRSPGSQS